MKPPVSHIICSTYFRWYRDTLKAVTTTVPLQKWTALLPISRMGSGKTKKFSILLWKNLITKVRYSFISPASHPEAALGDVHTGGGHPDHPLHGYSAAQGWGSVIKMLWFNFCYSGGERLNPVYKDSSTFPAELYPINFCTALLSAASNGTWVTNLKTNSEYSLLARLLDTTLAYYPNNSAGAKEVMEKVQTAFRC